MMTDQEYLNELREGLEQLRDEVINYDWYKPVAPLEVMIRAQEYYNNHWPLIKDLLHNKGVSATTIQTVSGDYLSLLLYGGNFIARMDQIREVLQALEPAQVCINDHYGLYGGLLSSYARFLKIHERYINEVKNGTEAQRQQFFVNIPSAPTAKAFTYLIDTHTISIDDVTGVDVEILKNYIDTTRKLATLCDYTIFFIVAKNAFKATPSELAEIKRPIISDGFNVLEFAEYIDTVKGEFYFETFNPSGHEQPRPGKAVQLEIFTPEPATVENDNNSAPIRIPHRIALIEGRPVNIARDKNNVNDILPIQTYIDDWLKSNDNYKDKGITPHTVGRAIEGINLLQRLSNVIPVNHEYIYNTNISQFAKLCGYTDANQEIKKQLLGSLLVLSNLFVVVWEQKGRTAIRVANVREIGLDTGDLEVRVSEEVSKGKPTLVDANSFETMRKQSKGEAQNRFRYQVMGKGHKTEKDLLNEVFGYDNMILEATHGTGDQITYAVEVKNVKEYIRKKKSEHKKKLKAWFDMYQNTLRVITYKSYTNQAGDLVYEWEMQRTDIN